MTALTASRITPTKLGNYLALVGGGNGYLGGMGAINAAGAGVAASADPSLIVVGIIDRDFVLGDDFNVFKSIAALTNSDAGPDQITAADIGQDCYAVDDATVAKTNGGGTRPRAGRIEAVDEHGVWVDFYLGGVSRKLYVPTTVDTLVGANTYRAVAPVGGRVTKVLSITEGVLTTGDATLTPKIGATPITGAVITITQAGSAAGDVDSAVPTGANACNAGDGLSVTVGGTNATATKARYTFEITY